MIQLDDWYIHRISRGYFYVCGYNKDGKLVRTNRIVKVITTPKGKKVIIDNKNREYILGKKKESVDL